MNKNKSYVNIKIYLKRFVSGLYSIYKEKFLLPTYTKNQKSYTHIIQTVWQVYQKI